METLLFLGLLSISSFADNKIEKSYGLDDFTTIFLKGPYDVCLKQGDICSLTFKAKPDFFEKLDVSSTRGVFGN